MSNKKMTNAEIVKAFNKLKAKPYLTVKDLQPSKPQRLLSMFRHRAKYGNVIVAELENGILYLPKRYNNLDDKVLEGSDSGNFLLTKKLNNNECLLELEKALPGDEKDEDDDETISIPNSQPFFNWETTKIPKICKGKMSRTVIHKFLKDFDGCIFIDHLNMIQDFLKLSNENEYICDKPTLSKYGAHYKNCIWSSNIATEGPDTCRCMAYDKHKANIDNLIKRYYLLSKRL